MIKSIEPFIPYSGKLILCSIDKRYKINKYSPPLFFYVKIFEEESIEGMNFLYSTHYKDMYGFLKTRYFVPTVFKYNKTIFLKWLIKQKKKEINNSIKYHVKRYLSGNFRVKLSKEFLNILKTHGFLKKYLLKI
jgi:hypothetical protein